MIFLYFWHCHFFNLFLIDIYAPSWYYIVVPREQREKENRELPLKGGRKEGFIMKKFCTRCGKEFNAVGREVICPSCKAQAAEENKRAAVERAKRASWNGESVPVRISGRASTLIRMYASDRGLSFAEALDALLRSTEFFKATGREWEDVEPYKSHRRDKHATENTTETAQDGTQAAQDGPVKPAKQAAKKAASTSKAAGKKVKA